MRVETRTPVASSAPPQKPTCEKCGRRGGDTYSFHYGKRTSRTTQRQGNRYIHTTRYALGGKREAAACAACIRRRRVLEAVQPALAIAVGAGVWWWFFFQEGVAEHLVRKPENAAGLRWALTAVGCLGLLIGLHELYLRLFGSKAGPAGRLLISLKKDEMRRQGFDSFWDTETFRKLRL